MTPNQRPGVGRRPHCASAAWTRSEGTWAPGDTWPRVARSHTHTCCRRYFRHPLLSRLEKVSCCKAKSTASPDSRLLREPGGRVTRRSWLGERPRPASQGPGSCWGVVTPACEELPRVPLSTQQLHRRASAPAWKWNAGQPRPPPPLTDQLKHQALLMANPESHGPEWRPGPDADNKA